MMEGLKRKSGSNLYKLEELMTTKEIWLDKLRGKIIKLAKQEEKEKRLRNDSIFQKDERNFYRKVIERSEYTGQTLNIEKFVNFWASIWEDESTTPRRNGWRRSNRK